MAALRVRAARRWAFAASVGVFFAGRAGCRRCRAACERLAAVKYVHAAGPRVPVGSSKRARARRGVFWVRNPFCLTLSARCRPTLATALQHASDAPSS